MHKRSNFDKALRGVSTWFERQKRVLPWRDEPTPYRVWISEIMLQQTQVVTVVPYFERFLARFPDVESLASAPLEDVLLNWAGLGYYSRARNLHRAAQAMVAAGRFPRTREEWLEVPGVGPYTAGAILSISADVPEAILDGNVERVVSRVRRLSRAGGDALYKARLWRLAGLYVERSHGLGLRPSVMNQALMELGATVCTPRKPKCGICPVREHCRAHARSEEEAYPPKKKKKEWLAVEEKLHCVLDSKGRVLLRLREKGEWRAGLWDLLGDRELEALRARGGLRELGEVETRHVVTRHKVTRKTRVWRATSLQAAASTADASQAEKMKWVNPENPEVAVGSALRRTLQRIRETE